MGRKTRTAQLTIDAFQSRFLQPSSVARTQHGCTISYLSKTYERRNLVIPEQFMNIAMKACERCAHQRDDELWDVYCFGHWVAFYCKVHSFCINTEWTITVHEMISLPVMNPPQLVTVEDFSDGHIKVRSVALVGPRITLKGTVLLLSHDCNGLIFVVRKNEVCIWWAKIACDSCSCIDSHHILIPNRLSHKCVMSC